ncbi:hypothetical protein [[Pseudomonas] boreopolis]|uniref:hypothetical protein n=1 Tax=Xanthomonas boreopolis TaxID=86183 RepID=UPI003D3751B2
MSRETGTITRWNDGAGVIRSDHMPGATGDVTFTAANVIAGEPRAGARCAFTLKGPPGERWALAVRVWPC